MPSKKIVSSKKDPKKEQTPRKKPRPISPLGGGSQGGMLSGYGTGTDR